MDKEQYRIVEPLALAFDDALGYLGEEDDTPKESKRPRASLIVSVKPSRRERRRPISLGGNSFESKEGLYSGGAAAGRV